MKILFENTFKSCNFNKIMNKVKISVVGIGLMGNQHLNDIERSHKAILHSIVDINNIVGKDSFVGFASKDGSTLKGNNISFNNVNIPFSSYVKKSEYDKAILEINDVRYQNYLIPYLKDQHSLIEINNDTKKNVNNEVLEIIYNKNIAALQKN